VGPGNRLLIAAAAAHRVESDAPDALRALDALGVGAEARVGLVFGRVAGARGVAGAVLGGPGAGGDKDLESGEGPDKYGCTRLGWS